MDLILVSHGPAVAGLLAATIVAVGALGLPALFALRAGWWARRLGWGGAGSITRAAAGDRVIVHGLLVARGGATGIDGRPCGVISVGAGHDRFDERAPTVSVRTGLRAVPVIGTITLDHAVSRRPLDRLVPDAMYRLAERDRDPKLSSAMVLRAAPGDHVVVLGRAMAVAGTGTDYRSAARVMAIGPGEDGRVHAIGLGSPLATITRLAIVGGMVGIAAVATAIALVPPLARRPVLRSPISLTESDDHVPLAYWVPLAHPELRPEALARTSSWVRSQLTYRDDDHTIALALALREVHEDCAREGWLALRRPDTYAPYEGRCDEDARRALARSETREQRALLVRLVDRAAERGAAVDLPALDQAMGVDPFRVGALGPSTGVDRIEIAYELATLLSELGLRSRELTAYRAAWLRDLALFEAAWGHHEAAARLLAAAREDRADGRDTAIVAAAIALARTVPRRWTCCRGDLARAAVSRAPYGTRERTLLESIASSTYRIAGVETIALLRAAGAADRVGAAAEARALTEQALSVVLAARPVDPVVREALMAELR